MTGWKCPLSGDPKCPLSHAVSLDGGLRHAVVDTFLLSKGWRIVNFPKRSYYMEFDQTHPSYKEKDTIQMIDNTDTLHVEVL